MREYRAPTRFTRAGTDATLAVAALARGKITPEAAARRSAPICSTHTRRVCATTLDSAVAAARRGFDVRLAETAALARGYAPDRRRALPRAARRAAPKRLDAALARSRARRAEAVAPRSRRRRGRRAALEGFRAAPLAPAEQARRAGQLDRFLRLVPIEYDRGVEGSRVTLAFEIQEAITFRDAAAASLADIAPTLLAPRRRATRELTANLESLGTRSMRAAAAAPSLRPSASRRRRSARSS